MSKLPKFLCVGAQKAGTTWLYAVLSQNPHVFLPRVKELLHFVEVPPGESDQWRHRMILESTVAACNTYIHNERDTLRPGFAQYILSYGAPDRFSDAWYERIYSAAPQGAMSGDITPEYMMMGRRGIERARKLLGDFKVILILRDPVERLWSQVRMIASENHLDPITDYHEIVSRFGSKKNSDYEKHVPVWIDEIPPDRLGIFNFHALARDGAEFYDTVLDFLDLPPHKAPRANTVVHQGASHEMPPEIAKDLADRLGPQIAFMDTTFGSEWAGAGPRLRPKSA